MTPGRKLVSRMSVSPASCSMISRPSSLLMSSRSERLPRLQLANNAEKPPLAEPKYRIGSPSSIGSTLMTSAPCSANIMAANDAVTMVENSRTLMPSSGFIDIPPRTLLATIFAGSNSHDEKSSFSTPVTGHLMRNVSRMMRRVFVSTIEFRYAKLGL